jgi:hypothetical protein
MAQSNFSEALKLVSSWAEKTERTLLVELRLNGIGITEDLKASVHAQVLQKAGEQIQVDLSFLTRGRFRDMGAGSERKVERMETNRRLAKSRKPAPWYSKPFYGRLGALSGAIGYKIMEQSIQTVIKPLLDGTERR